MRLIDADAAIKAIYELHADGEDGVRNAPANTYGADLREVIETIEELPTAEERSGRWDIQNDKGQPLFGWFFCSECGSVVGTPTPRYCSACGARMRNGDEWNEID